MDRRSLGARFRGLPSWPNGRTLRFAYSPSGSPITTPSGGRSRRSAPEEYEREKENEAESILDEAMEQARME